MDTAVRVAIVEDNESDRELVKRGLARYSAEFGRRFDIAEFADGEDLVTNYSAEYDLLLMDIKMAFMDGMRTARQVREMDSDVVIVFITNMPQYAIEGYKVRAVDYILKPISWLSFSESITRALHYVRPRTSAFITIAQKGGRMKLELERICYVEAQDHLLMFNTLDGNYTTKGTMREAEAQLSGSSFFRCNRCYLVNLRYIQTYQGCDILVNGNVIQVSRRRRKSFLDALNAHINGDHQ